LDIESLASVQSSMSEKQETNPDSWQTKNNKGLCFLPYVKSHLNRRTRLCQQKYFLSFTPNGYRWIMKFF
jgi:hypothetical protein